jgi:hypothetical protein
MAEDRNDFMKIWTQDDPASQRKIRDVILGGLDRVVQADSDVLSRIRVEEPIASPVARWMEEWGYPSRITGQVSGDTITFSGVLFGSSVTAENVRKVTRPGTILEHPSNGAQIKVSSVDGLVATMAPYGNTTLTDDTRPVNWEIIAEVWSDFREGSTARSLDRFFRQVGTQIHAETFEIPKTRKNTDYEVVPYELEHQMVALFAKLRRQLAYAVIRSRPQHDGTDYVYGDRTEESTMCGLCSWPVITQEEVANPHVFVNKNGISLTKQDLNLLVRSVWLDEMADYHKGDWWIVCHPTVHQYIQDFDISCRRMDRDERNAGFQVHWFDSKIGKSFPILPERYMRQDVLLVVNFDAFRYGYFEDDTCDIKEIMTRGRYQRWLISFQTYGVVARNPRSNIGMIYGLPAA